jgi:hypothetical protein
MNPCRRFSDVEYERELAAVFSNYDEYRRRRSMASDSAMALAAMWFGAAVAFFAAIKPRR